MALAILWILGGLIFIGLLLSHNYTSLMHAKLPMGDFGWPFLGETLSFLQPHSSDAQGNFLKDRCSRYGKIFKSHLFFSPTIVSCDHELNHLILQNEDRLFQASYPRPFHELLGRSSVLVAVEETHKRLRSVAMALISATKAKPEFLNDVERMALYVMNGWKEKEEVFLCEEARMFTFGVIVEQIMGLSPNDSTSASILQDFNMFTKGLISFPLYIPGLSYAKAVQARRRLLSTLKKIIEKRARTAADPNTPRGSKDFLDVLVSVGNLSNEEKVSFLLEFLLGGYETTSQLVAMVVHFLGHCPAALNRLLLEHRNIRGNRDEKDLLTSDDYKKMKFTQNVINEALRCGNIIKLVHRKAIKDVVFKDYLIPSGWKVLPVLSAVNLDPSLHADATTFNPWRWEDHDHARSKKFIPFGGGIRLCPGSELARVETAIFLHHFLLNFRWRASQKDGPAASLFVHFPNGLPLKVEPLVCR